MSTYKKKTNNSMLKVIQIIFIISKVMEIGMCSNWSWWAVFIPAYCHITIAVIAQ